MKSDMPANDMRKVLTAAMADMNPVVVKVLATASPEYLSTRAAEAFAAGDLKTALVLLAWGLVPPPPKPAPQANDI